MKKTIKQRGYYKVRSYRFSDETNEEFKKLGKEIGSHEKAMQYLLRMSK